MSDAGTPLPPPPPPPPLKFSPSHQALVGLIAFLILAKILQLATHMPLSVPGAAVLFSWKAGVAFFIALALLGAGFAHVDAFPGMWDEAIGNGGRVWLPLAIGAALGLALLVAGRAAHFSQALQAATGAPRAIVAYPYALLYYPYVAVCAAILFHLFSLSFAVWFVGVLLLARSWPRATFWIMAILISLWEPLSTAWPHHWALLHGPALPGIVAMLALYYAGDLIGAILFRRCGFTAVLLLRLSMVIVWHIILRA